VGVSRVAHRSRSREPPTQTAPRWSLTLTLPPTRAAHRGPSSRVFCNTRQTLASSGDQIPIDYCTDDRDSRRSENGPRQVKPGSFTHQTGCTSPASLREDVSNAAGRRLDPSRIKPATPHPPRYARMSVSPPGEGWILHALNRQPLTRLATRGCQYRRRVKARILHALNRQPLTRLATRGCQ
jgi:hypothetical protein